LLSAFSHPDEKFEDVTEVKLDANAIYTADKEIGKIKMPVKEFRTLKEKLLRATACI